MYRKVVIKHNFFTYIVNHQIFIDNFIAEIYKSCRDALTQNPGSQRFFWIMPEGISTAVYARCFKQADSTYMMRINHNGEARTYSSGYESSQSYHKSFTYLINSLSDIAAVVDVLGSCKQFTKVECKHMVYTAYGGLVGRNGKFYSGYLGGGLAEGKGCACGVTTSCHTSTRLCNCDSNVDTLLKDEGYVTNSTILPITGIKLGDTGSSTEYAYHTVGSLQCYGMNFCSPSLKYLSFKFNQSMYQNYCA